jgi:hypothetical protein
MKRNKAMSFASLKFSAQIKSLSKIRRTLHVKWIIKINETLCLMHNQYKEVWEK